MDLSDLKLRRLPASLRIAIACVVLSIAIGEAASLVHLMNHHGVKDGDPRLTLTDLESAYHGIDQPSRLARSLDAAHVREHAPDDGERAALRSWLAGNRVNEEYDDEDRLGERTPALILERRCTSCHALNPKDPEGAKGVAQTLPLDSWSDVSRVAFARRLDAVSPPILAMSTHAHALALPPVALAVGLLCLATSWPRALVRWSIALGAIGLFVDLVSWWLARPDFLATVLPFDRIIFVKAIVAGGAAFSVALALQLALVLIDLLRPRDTPRPT